MAAEEALKSSGDAGDEAESDVEYEIVEGDDLEAYEEDPQGADAWGDYEELPQGADGESAPLCPDTSASVLTLSVQAILLQEFSSLLV